MPLACRRVGTEGDGVRGEPSGWEGTLGKLPGGVGETHRSAIDLVFLYLPTFDVKFPNVVLVDFHVALPAPRDVVIYMIHAANMLVVNSGPLHKGLQGQTQGLLADPDTQCPRALR